MEIRNKKFVLIFAFILLLNFCCAIRINEVEMNPLGGSAEKEWIELYNEEDIEINISGWEIWEGIVSGLVNPKKINPSFEGIILQSKEYYIFEFNNKLNNDGDFVTLYNNSGGKVDETPTLKEEKNSSKSHQFCSSSWKFRSSTKGSENNCSEQTPEETQPTQSETTEQQEENLTTQETETPNNPPRSTSNSATSSPKSTAKTITLEPIALNIKSEDNKEILKKNLALSGIITFCFGFGALFLLKTLRRKKENEFR